MKLSEYPRPKGPQSNRGIHLSASTDQKKTVQDFDFWAKELLDMGVKWAKLLDDSRQSSLDLCRKLIGIGIIPIVRLYRHEPNLGVLDADALYAVDALAGAGVRYFEVNNEPNLRCEWKLEAWNALPREERVNAVMRNWLKDAKEIIIRGGLPGFPALAQCAHTASDDADGSIPWHQQAFKFLKISHENDARYIFEHGAWLAVHNATLNHPWEFPRGTGGEPTIWSDDCCLRGYEIPWALLLRTFGLRVPVISTEGGVFLPPQGQTFQHDNKFPAYNTAQMADMTVSMFGWLEKHEPFLYFAMCPWLIANEKMGHTNKAWTKDAWYQKNWTAEVVAKMKATKQTVDLDEAIGLEAQAHVLPYVDVRDDTAPSLYVALWREDVAPQSREFDVTVSGVSYRCLIGRGCVVNGQAEIVPGQVIAYCPVGDWDNVKIIRREE